MAVDEAVMAVFLSSHLSLNREGRWGTTDDFATSSLHFSPFSTALWDLANFKFKPVHSLMLSSHLFLCLPCLLPPFYGCIILTQLQALKREPLIALDSRQRELNFCIRSTPLREISRTRSRPNLAELATILDCSDGADYRV